jgi:hypothetical protein
MSKSILSTCILSQSFLNKSILGSPVCDKTVFLRITILSQSTVPFQTEVYLPTTGTDLLSLSRLTICIHSTLLERGNGLRMYRLETLQAD